MKITDACIGCAICAEYCPVDAIIPTKKSGFMIHPDLCNDCGDCLESDCPVNAIKR